MNPGSQLPYLGARITLNEFKSLVTLSIFLNLFSKSNYLCTIVKDGSVSFDILFAENSGATSILKSSDFTIAAFAPAKSTGSGFCIGVCKGDISI